MAIETGDGEAALRELAEGQHGVVSRQQVRTVGMNDDQLHRLVGTGRWVRHGPHALALAGAPMTERWQVALATLGTGPGAVLSHHSAAAFWGLIRFRLSPPHVMVPNGRSTWHLPGTILHRTRRLPAHHVVEVEGLRITTPARTVFDLSGCLRPTWRAESALDDAWAARLVDFASMHRVVDELSGRGQRNVAQLRTMVDERGPHHVPGDSALERQLHRIVAKAGLPPLRRQAEMTDPEGWWGRVDGVWDDAMIIVEVDGDRWHTTLTQRRRDAERHLKSQAMGYTTLRFTEHDVWQRPEAVVVTLWEARRSGLARHSRRSA